MNDFQAEKSLVMQFYGAIEEADENSIANVLTQYTSDNYQFRGVHPFNEIAGAEQVATQFWQPLLKSFRNMERRQDVFIAGENQHDGKVWVTSMGHFMGLFDNDWLGIPKSNKVAMLRYADFNQVENGKIVQTGFFCDIIQLMGQVGINPLPLETGHTFIYPGPKTHDGIITSPQAAEESQKTLDILESFIDDLSKLNVSAEDNYPSSVLEKSWHNNMAWYGPAGIGASYTIRRYQQQHSYPFRQGLKDKVFNGHIARFAEGNYAAFFGWPNLTNSPKGGFLGLPGSDTRADMRVVDVYRREGDKLVENWVIIDLLHWLKQQGLDVLARTQSIVNPQS
ncbi:nuclear transport factor 2 family protein [Alteromonadaceae bacterium M269]|nr:nuclear transport factor 2 family protein [Alteromonadaceae bacterium M269]